MALTKKSVDAAKPASTEYFLTDSAMPGLCLRVHPSGRKVWVLRYRTEAGVQRKLTIGKAEVYSLDEARRRARDAMVAVDDGGDPTQDRRSKRTGLQVTGLVEMYLKSREGKAKPYSLGLMRGYLRKHIAPKLGHLAAVQVTALEISTFHADMAAKPYMANRCLSLLRSSFDHAEMVGIRPRGSNPAAEVGKFKERQRQTILTLEQLLKVLRYLATYQPRAWSASYLLRFLILTGMRKMEPAGARWEWVDLIDGVLRLPDTKTGAREVVLNDAALGLLRELRARVSGPWVFPNEHQDGPLTQINRHWERVCKRSGVPVVRVHDIRHTVGSLSHKGGLSQRDVAWLLGHRNMRTTARYIHEVGDKRETANKAVEAVLGSAH